MAMRIIDGIRYREEDVELLHPVLSKTVRQAKAEVENKAARRPRKSPKAAAAAEGDGGPVVSNK